MSQMNNEDLCRNKQSIFKSIIKDIANKYENINKKLLISFKNDFIHANSTNEVIGSINQEKFRRQIQLQDNRNVSHYLETKENKRSEISYSNSNFFKRSDKRYSSINFSPKVEYGQGRDLNTAYTSNSRKRKSHHSKPKNLLNGESISMIDREKDISVGERKSVTIGEIYPTNTSLGNPIMYKSKPRIQSREQNLSKILANSQEMQKRFTNQEFWEKRKAGLKSIEVSNKQNTSSCFEIKAVKTKSIKTAPKNKRRIESNQSDLSYLATSDKLNGKIKEINIRQDYPVFLDPKRGILLKDHSISPKIDDSHEDKKNKNKSIQWNKLNSENHAFSIRRHMIKMKKKQK